jgi:hypothetical protein
VIPFGAVRIFQDPSVHFALALRSPEPEEAGEKSGAETPLLPTPESGAAPTVPTQDDSHPDRAIAASAPPEPEHDPRAERHTAEVVSLDKFRKK